MNQGTQGGGDASSFEDRFRYDEAGVPRVWRPADDIEGSYSKAREATLQLIPLLSRFQLESTSKAPPLAEWIGPRPPSTTTADEDDLMPVGGLDDLHHPDGVDGEGDKTLDEEMVILSDGKRRELTVRFKKTADGVFVEARRGAIGGVTQIPFYFYGILLALGWNEIVAGDYFLPLSPPPRSTLCDEI